MRFMMLMIPAVYRDNQAVPAAFNPDPQMMERMGRFNDEMKRAGILSDLNGLEPLAAGARVDFTAGKPTVTNGPGIRATDVLGGYWLIEAKSKDEVIEWAKRCPAQPGDIIEIRQIYGG